MTETAKKKNYENNVTLIGELKDFEVREVTTKKGVPMKIANLQVSTGEGEVHRANMMALAYYEKDGKKEENKAYKAIQTIEEEYVSAKKVAEEELDVKPTVVRVNGSLENNMYKGRNGNLVESTIINARFVNRVQADPEEFGVTFKIHAFALSQAAPVLDKDDNETGTVKLKVATINYQGEAQPFEVQADDEYGIASWAEDNISLGLSFTISGQWFNKYNLIQVERPNPAGIGKPIVDTKREIDNRIFVEGIIPYDDEEDLNYISQEDIKKAIEKYEAHKVEETSKSTKEQAPKVTKGVVSSKPSASSVVVSEEDLPF